MPVADNCNIEYILYPYACCSLGLRKGLEEKNRYVIIKLQKEDAVQSLAIPGAVYKSKKGINLLAGTYRGRLPFCDRHNLPSM